MPFTALKPFSGKPPSTGVSFSMNGSKNPYCRVTLNATAQDEIFGQPIAGKKIRASIGRGSDAGLLLLELCDDGGLTATATMKGAATIKMQPWPDLPFGEKRPSEQIELIKPTDTGFIFKLPAWTLLQAPKKITEQFGHGISAKKARP